MGKIIIAYGLPGSGKSYYGNKLEEDRKAFHIEMDGYIDRNGEYPSVRTTLMPSHFSYFKDIYIDSLITTNDTLEQVIYDAFLAARDNGIRCPSFEILEFEGTRQTCMENAKRRNDGRDVSVTIENIPLEQVDKKRIEAYVKGLGKDNIVVFMKRKVFDNSVWDIYFQPELDSYNGDGERYIYSESWSQGGSWGDCWGNEGTIHAEEPPKVFKEFDELLEKICPDITFLQYKSISAECMDTEEWDEADYYGGVEYRARYRVDLKKLHDELTRRGIIEK